MEEEQKSIKTVYQSTPAGTNEKPKITLSDIRLGSHRVAAVGATGSRVFTRDGQGTIYILTEFKDGTTKWQQCPEAMLAMQVHVLNSVATILTQHV